MKIYVINLKHRLDRKQFMLDQFEKYGITDYEFIEAVDGSVLDIVSSGYDDVKSKKIFRSLSRNEIGCVLSHNIAYRKIIRSGQRGIILEDDCALTEELKQFASLNIPENLDVVMLGYRSSNRDDALSKQKTFKYEIVAKQATPDGSNSITYFKNEKVSIGSFDFHKVDDQSYKVDFMVGTHAYSPSLHMCKILLGFNNKPKVPADITWNILHDYEYDINMWAPIIPIAAIEANDKLGSDIVNDIKPIIKNEFENNGSPYIQRVTSELFGT